ncbi:MAG TPA: acyltransferase, partial [Candidatus Limnocylindrales bacterium]|nr:acyltransferase [Candidatus Limnocylindrales bacterium]
MGTGAGAAEASPRRLSSAYVGRLGYRPELDGLRGVAILIVMLGHLNVLGLGAAAKVGVMLFFVLSGYLITSLMVAEQAATGTVDLRAFYLRRAARLLPALLLVLIVVGLLYQAEGWAFGPVALPVIAYVGNWVIALGGHMPFLTHTWSLAIEEQFYLLWPVAFLLIGRSRHARNLLIAFALGAVVWRLASPPPFATNATVTMADGILIGCALGLGMPSLRSMTAVTGWGLLLVSLIIGVAGANRLDLAVATLAGAVLIMAAEQQGSRILASAPLRMTGRISYGLYLWNSIIIDVLGLRSVSLLIALPVGLLCSFAAAALSYRYVERPFLRWKARLGRSSSGWHQIDRVPS